METAELPISIKLTAEGAKIFGHAHLGGTSEPIFVTARAMRHIDGSIDHWARDLVVARLLRGLEIELMERVHERIDRSLADDV